MRVAVCDDDVYTLRVVGEYFKGLGELGAELHVDYFASGRELMRAFIREPYDLFLLNVRLDGGGMDIARAVCRRQQDLFIIFISSCAECVLEAGGCYYLLKPLMYTEFCRVIRSVVRRSTKTQPKFSASFNREVISLDMDDIFYFESYQRKTFVCTGKARYRIADRLDVVEKRLPEDRFLRIHQGYIVNLNHVRSVKNQELILTDGRSLEISFRRRREVSDRFRRYFLQ